MKLLLSLELFRKSGFDYKIRERNRSSFALWLITGHWIMLGLIPYWTWEIINIFEKDLKWGFHRKGSETKSGTQVTYSALIKTKILNVQKKTSGWHHHLLHFSYPRSSKDQLANQTGSIKILLWLWIIKIFNGNWIRKFNFNFE